MTYLLLEHDHDAPPPVEGSTTTDRWTSDDALEVRPVRTGVRAAAE